MKNALIIFVRKPLLGKVKTRLAATIGNEKALQVYNFLLQHTFNVIKELPLQVYVFYAGELVQDDIWQGGQIVRKIQQGNDLGQKMANAFQQVFLNGHSKVVIIGSDCYELTTPIILQAFEKLSANEMVVGPAKDGGYYLLGINAPFKNVFENIAWSTNTVFNKTIEIIIEKNYSWYALPVLSDVDTEEDITFSY